MSVIVPYRIITACLIIVCISAQAYEIKGKVVKVADGDTITILDVDKNQHKIRLADIDAPESGQPYGKKSKQYLAELIKSKAVVADCREKDRYKRHVCTVFIGKIDVNARMVESGHAWVYQRYNRRAELYALQNAARDAQRGLWRLPEAQRMNPAEWRRKT